MKKIEEGVDFTESANTPIQGGKVVNVAYLLILRTGGMKNPVNVGRHAGWTENLSGFQGPFQTSQQALTDPQESNSGGPWVWGVSKYLLI